MQTITVTMDRASGRLVLPKKIRDGIDSNIFEVSLEKNRVILNPKKGLAGLFGRAPGVDMKEFDRERRKEIRREDSS